MATLRGVIPDIARFAAPTAAARACNGGSQPARRRGTWAPEAPTDPAPPSAQAVASSSRSQRAGSGAVPRSAWRRCRGAGLPIRMSVRPRPRDDPPGVARIRCAFAPTSRPCRRQRSSRAALGGYVSAETRAESGSGRTLDHASVMDRVLRFTGPLRRTRSRPVATLSRVEPRSPFDVRETKMRTLERCAEAPTATERPSRPR